MRKEDQNISHKTPASFATMKMRSTAPFANELINEKRKSRCFLERKHAEGNVKERNCFCGRAYYMGVRIMNKFTALLYRINSTWIYKRHSDVITIALDSRSSCDRMYRVTLHACILERRDVAKQCITRENIQFMLAGVTWWNKMF